MSGEAVWRSQVEGEVASALRDLRRLRNEPHSAGSPSHPYRARTPEEALAVFIERQDAYARSISQGILDLREVSHGRPRTTESEGVEPWPELEERLASWRMPLSKRAFDIIFSAVALLFIAPLFVLIAVAVRLSSPGPALFRQSRVGEAGKPIRVLKFRTMYDPEMAAERYVVSASEAALFKLRDDPRVTRVGIWLRRTALDEMPQLVNVLMGDMSLVGPRALRPEELPLLGGWERARLRIRPGLTGPWQLSDPWRYAGVHEMVRQDLNYALRWSFWRDLKLMARTVRQMFVPHAL